MNNPHDTDFIDADLNQPRFPRPDLHAEDLEGQNQLGKMQQQRAQLEEEVSSAARELESLHQQQQNLLKRKQTLESLRQQQGEYVEEKQHLSRRIHQCLGLLDKEEMRVAQLQEVYANSRTLFSRLERELLALGEGGWSEEEFQPELIRVTDALEGVRMEFKKGLTRLDALDWTSEQSSETKDRGNLQNYGFTFWLKVGAGIAVPLCVLGGFTALFVHWILTNTAFGP
ncbi:hypothetical protein P3T73_12690 [Kiritimatiellota bacterium B12222]|nr:hypothetical protein P3T73_12690 [Kiritimatiellota bacterium B12222]